MVRWVTGQRAGRGVSHSLKIPTGTAYLNDSASGDALKNPSVKSSVAGGERVLPKGAVKVLKSAEKGHFIGV